MGWVTRPYSDRLVLRRRRYVGFLQDGGRPGYISDPVGVAGEFCDGGVGFVLCAADLILVRKFSEMNNAGRVSMREEVPVFPDFDYPVTSSRHKSSRSYARSLAF